jgi:hypothetical protein
MQKYPAMQNNTRMERLLEMIESSKCGHTPNPIIVGIRGSRAAVPLFRVGVLATG